MSELTKTQGRKMAYYEWIILSFTHNVISHPHLKLKHVQHPQMRAVPVRVQFLYAPTPHPITPCRLLITARRRTVIIYHTR